MNRLKSAVLRLLQMNRQVVALVVYGSIAAIAYVVAFLLRFEFMPPPPMIAILKATLPVVVALRVITSLLFQVSAGRWRFAGTSDVLRLMVATTTGTIVLYLLGWRFGVINAVPRSVIAFEWVLTTYSTAGLWLIYRVVVERVRRARYGGTVAARRVLIVGAGEAGSLLAREMGRTATGYRPVGFIDDDRTKLRMTVHGLPVLGTTSELPIIAQRTRAQEIVIAAPSAKPEELRRIVEQCEASEVRFKVLPGVASVIAGDVHLNALRELRIEDLLGREPIHLQLPELYDDLHNEVVLITGAAGSIGSELARQVALHAPRQLVLLDQAETPLFFLEHELRSRIPGLDVVFIVGDVVDRPTIKSIFESFAPSRVYHAAAYKHVPMMQLNTKEAVRNNVHGTWCVAELAARHGAAKFVLVSTDKAVRPTSIMGASKRLAEIAVVELQNEFPKTIFTAVRFGNVLGSNGSVIPLFKQQIQDGVPLTVTHRDCTRYFMTIPEAVHLILQASLLPELRGRIAMLEMGEPIRIIELAKNLLRLSGLPCREGENIVFTGLRPGEKLHEELFSPDEASETTTVDKVQLVAPANVNNDDLPAWFRSLESWNA